MRKYNAEKNFIYLHQQRFGITRFGDFDEKGIG